MKKLNTEINEMNTKKTNENVANGITELVFILDRSGSMAGLESDTIGGFNSVLQKQKKLDGEGYVTTVLFDHELLTLHDRIAIDKVQPMTDKDYEVRGCTALIDAIGTTVKHIESVHRYLRQEDIPQNVMFVIITDGFENASKEYTAGQVRKMIEQKKENGWEFLFIGANIDAVETAGSFGIAPDRAVNYHADKKGTGVVFKAVGDACCAARCAAPLAASWSEAIDEDYQNR